MDDRTTPARWSRFGALFDAANMPHVVRRNPAASAILLLVVAGLVVSFGMALWQAHEAREAGARSLDESIALQEPVAPSDPDEARALIRQGKDLLVTDPVKAASVFERAIAAADGMRGNQATELQRLAWPGLAQAHEARGDYAEAKAAYERWAVLARPTQGETHSRSWTSTAEFAWMLHRYGNRERAMAIFDGLMSSIPRDWSSDASDEYAREFYAAALAAEGRAALAIPILEAAVRVHLGKPGADFELGRIGLTLGDAYDRDGLTQDARAALKAAYDQRLAKDEPGSPSIRAVHERWGRFLLDHGEPVAAEAEFREVLAIGAGRNFVEVALAHAGLARLALAHGDVATADMESRTAVEVFDHVIGSRDVRVGPMLWLVRSQVLLGAGFRAGALALAQRALEASRSWDDPSAPSIAAAEAAVRAAVASPLADRL